MNFPDAFTLHQSASATVRVEPPDLVLVEGPGLGPFRFRRSHVRQCRAMLVGYYRERVDPTYRAANADGIVVQLHVEGMARELLGPFPHREGVDLAGAINLARRDVLFARPGFSASIADDGCSLVLATHDGRMTVPAPTPELVELALRDDQRVDARYAIASGLAVTGAARWIELRFLRGKPWLLGPLATADAATLAFAFRTWRGEHPLDREPTEVEERELLASPTRWHARRIAVAGDWYFGFESSRFANVWLDVPEDQTLAYGAYRVRVVGTWIYPDAASDSGYGHMGCSPGELRAETIDVLEVTYLAGQKDGLTGLPTRAVLTRSFGSARGETCAFALLDLDHFKRINDAHGHVLGDEVLRRWSAAVVAAVGESATVARWGGEELAVVLPGASLEAASAVIEGALAAVRALAIAAGSGEVRMTCSAGVVAVARGEALGQVVTRADAALYEAKRAGRDRAVTG